jgi:hypothetical protein
MARKSLTIFVITTVALLATAVIGTRLLPDDVRKMPISTVSESPQPGHYLSTDNATTLDQLIFHHQLEDIAGSIKQADVVFAGNSRSLFAFRAHTCDPYFEDRNLKWYHAGFPSENNVFTEHILETYDATPQLVIVNADDFFTGNISTIARRSVDTSTFGAKKLYWESRMSYRMRNRLHQWLPHPPTMFFAPESMIVYRSLINGSWLVGETRGRSTGVDQHSGQKTASDRHLQIADRFQQFVNARGGEMILTYVPKPTNDRARAKAIARHLGCRFVAPQLARLRTIDGSHLDEYSAARFAAAFFRELETTDVANILNNRHPIRH